VDTPKFEVPAAWVDLQIANAEAATCFINFGYGGTDAQAIVSAFMSPGTHAAQHLMDANRDSGTTGITHRLSTCNKSTYYTADVVNPGGWNKFLDRSSASVPVYTTCDLTKAVEFMIVYTLTHINVHDLLDTVCAKLLHHFDGNASGTYKELQTRRAQIHAFYLSAAYHAEVKAVAKMEIARRRDVLLQAMHPLLVPFAKEHFSNRLHHPAPESMVLPAAKHALDIACARLQDRCDADGDWYSDAPAPEGTREALTSYTRSRRDDFDSPAHVAVAWFESAFTQALDLIQLGRGLD
jgi:hypothetical protein